ncbi:hypothetical protein GDO86_003954 [Hymenochirus boettgeri]|uniref:Protein EVI2A n=1 Tax=Hymenochirus boettgeri TaxID=247094 RepID=A0A8T2K607_9PIPI|nr:hypothetical protein GDO86_003954 [Hymenochirus boettgeri]
MQYLLKTIFILGIMVLLPNHAQINQTHLTSTISSITFEKVFHIIYDQNSTRSGTTIRKKQEGADSADKNIGTNTKVKTATSLNITEEPWQINITKNNFASTNKRTTLQNKLCSTVKYETGLLVCIIIIAVLVLVCSILIILSVVLANKVSRLKTKLTQSKRQARSNGDFLSASSILWPSGLDTLQKTSQVATLKMDDLILSDKNTTQEEKNQLMVTASEDLRCKENHQKPPENDQNLTHSYMVEI